MLTNKVNYSGLSDVAAFVCVVQTGSFTAAAEKLNTSKSVVSKYISRLEDRLDVKLLTRTTRRLTLTEIGQAFFDKACIGINAIDSAEEEVSFLQGKPRGQLNINAPLSFGALHIAPALTDFLNLFPEIKVDLRFSDAKVDMVKEGFDITVRITDKLEGNLVARRIAPCHHILVAAPDYVKRHGLLKSPEELEQHNVITYQYQHSPWEWSFSRNGETQHIAVHGDIQMNNSLAIREAVLAGAGISRMPTFTVGNDIKAGCLIQVLPDYKLLELSIYLIFAGREHMAPKIRSFIDFMVKRFDGIPDWDRFKSR
jgi:DNA-binding transcriptional LysR family regulator